MNTNTKGVTGSHVVDIDINTVISVCTRVSACDTSIIKRYINETPLVSSRVLFKTLMSVRALKVATKTDVVRKGHMFQDSVYAAIKYLEELGYIKRHVKSRIIVPFQRFKCDVAFVITLEGESALNSIIRSALNAA